MKKWLGLVLMTVLGSVTTAFAKPSLYLVEPMYCKGSQTSSDGYGELEMTFTSFEVTRRDGTLAQSLEIKTNFSSNIYTSPLMIEKGVIKKKFGYQDGDTLTLKVVNTIPSLNGIFMQELEGTFQDDGTVVGDTSYRIRCRANVVRKTSRVDDYTAKR